MLIKLVKSIKLQYVMFGLIGMSTAVLVAGGMGVLMVSSGNIHNHLLRSKVGNAVVKVLIPKKGGGSGFSIKTASGRQVIVTNEHVCAASDTGEVFIEQDSGLKSFKKIIHVDDLHDLCIVEGDFRLPALELGSSPVKGDFHYIVGHPGGRALTVSQGEYIGDENVQLPDLKVKVRKKCKHTIIELNPLEKFMYNMEFICMKSFRAYSSSAVAYGGNSGSPVVNAFGEVIGVLFAGSREQEHNNAIVPVEHLKRVLSLL